MENREILFRGKRVNGGGWAYGFYANCSKPGGNPHETGHYIIEYPGIWHEIYTSTLGEFTGLYDKNNTRIFEGDIVRDAHPSIKKNYDVIWLSGAFYRRTKKGRYLSLSCLNSNEHIIVGDIYDNPEMLKEREP